MQKIKKIFFSTAIFSLFSLSACENASLWEPSKYNRNDTSFSKVVENRNEIVICTTKIGKNTKNKVVQMAKMECAKFGKRAAYQNYSVATCALAQPVSWHFKCTAVN